jgi:inhibitor of KinA
MSYTIFPLGDSAITIDLGNHIDEQLNSKALAIQGWLEARSFPGVLDIIVAYSSVSVFFDPVLVREQEGPCREGALACMRKLLEMAWQGSSGEGGGESGNEGGEGSTVTERTTEDPGGQGRLLRIPVCYEGEYAPDLESFAELAGIPPGELIQLHTAPIYRVYMIGFLPGFPYLGKVDEKLRAPRKPRPVAVKAGGVGIAGNQTGIYTLNSPGGWQIIGRTPVPLFDPSAQRPARLRIGDSIQFCPISTGEFGHFHDFLP